MVKLFVDSGVEAIISRIEAVDWHIGFCNNLPAQFETFLEVAPLLSCRLNQGHLDLREEKVLLVWNFEQSLG